jgi:hypothetical protein
MSKYIAKQKAISALINEANTHNNPVKRAYTRAAAIIEQITAEDIQPEKHGRWICNEELYYNGMTKCSCCNEEYYTEDIQNLQGDLRTVNYCPNCGARMDGDKK